MKPFRYTMENVLDYRRNVEEEEKQKFSEVWKEYIRQKSILTGYEEKLDAAVASQCAVKTRKVYEWKNLQKYIHYLKEKTEIQRRLVQETERAMEEKRRQLISAQKDRKMIEKHKEKAREKYDSDVERAEQKTIDELALYSFMRNDIVTESLKGGEPR